MLVNGGWLVVPGQGDEALISLFEQRARGGLPTLKAQAQVGGQGERGARPFGSGAALLVAEVVYSHLIGLHP